MPTAVLLSDINENEAGEREWVQWRRTDKRAELQRISESIASMGNPKTRLERYMSVILTPHFSEHFRRTLVSVALHHCDTIQQRDYIKQQSLPLI